MMVTITNAHSAPAELASDQPAAIVTLPFVAVDSAHGQDTILQLSNAAGNETNVRCFYEQATNHCSDSATQFCSADEDCASNDCITGWKTTSFDLTLTALQPTFWRASHGRPPSIPAVGSDPFLGSVQCIIVDNTGKPIRKNALKGQATLERFKKSSAAFDVAKYNGIGIQAVGPNNGDNVLMLDGMEYDACPNVLIVSHLYDGAIEPAAQKSRVSTRLVLLPCTQDPFLQIPGMATVQYLTFNEFEQRFSVAKTMKVLQDSRLSQIDSPADPSSSLFQFSFEATLAGQTRVRGVGSGLLAVAVEEHNDFKTPSRLSSGAYNVDVQGDHAADELGGCGDGAVGPGEECDDGNAIDGDGCDSNCTVTACGNGIVTAGEQCDDGNLLNGDGCNSDCTIPPPPTATPTRAPTPIKTPSSSGCCQIPLGIGSTCKTSSSAQCAVVHGVFKPLQVCNPVTHTCVK
jgi:cysteine-rich repeat protein